MSTKFLRLMQQLLTSCDLEGFAIGLAVAISFGTSSFGGSFPKKSGQGKIPQFLTIQTMLNNYKETDNAFQRSPIIQQSRRTFNKFANMIIHPRPSLIHFASNEFLYLIVRFKTFTSLLKYPVTMFIEFSATLLEKLSIPCRT